MHPIPNATLTTFYAILNSICNTYSQAYIEMYMHIIHEFTLCHAVENVWRMK